jgi:hypothetical protein
MNFFNNGILLLSTGIDVSYEELPLDLFALFAS